MPSSPRCLRLPFSLWSLPSTLFCLAAVPLSLFSHLNATSASLVVHFSHHPLTIKLSAECTIVRPARYRFDLALVRPDPPSRQHMSPAPSFITGPSLRHSTRSTKTISARRTNTTGPTSRPPRISDAFPCARCEAPTRAFPA